MADVFLFRFAVDGEGSSDDVTLREQRLDHLKSINIYRVKLTNIHISVQIIAPSPHCLCHHFFKFKEKNFNISVKTEENKAKRSAKQQRPDVLICFCRGEAI